MVRVIGILLVVFGHSVYVSMGQMNYTEFFQAIGNSNITHYMQRIVGFAYSFHMPLFFYLSGLVYCITEKNYTDTSKFIAKKIDRLIIPAFIFGLFFMLPIKLNVGFYGEASYLDIAKGILRFQHSGHLWFLYSLFYCFVIFRTVRAITNNDLATIIIISSLILIGDSRFEALLPGFQHVLSGYKGLMYFSIGYYLKKCSKDTLLIKTTTLVVLLSIHLLVLRIDIIKPLILILSLELLSAFAVTFRALNKSRIISILTKYSFPIYIIHDPLNYAIIGAFVSIVPTTMDADIYFTLFYICRTIIIIIASILIWNLVECIKINITNQVKAFNKA
ncbi:acyltransferase [Photobacterium leiognathi]|uniref:acyltransferase n=1 Tax=Photobacterium leiognathi TaxID=553611 RepID=UPI0029815FF1|nr:acyltransferase [Photobacterium leiognathi]